MWLLGWGPNVTSGSGLPGCFYGQAGPHFADCLSGFDVIFVEQASEKVTPVDIDVV